MTILQYRIKKRPQQVETCGALNGVTPPYGFGRIQLYFRSRRPDEGCISAMAVARSKMHFSPLYRAIDSTAISPGILPYYGLYCRNPIADKKSQQTAEIQTLTNIQRNNEHD